MGDFIKSAWAEAFEGCTPLMIAKRIIALVIITIVLCVFCGADSVGGFWVAITLAMAVVLWKVLGLSSAYPDTDTDTDGNKGNKGDKIILED